MLIPARKVRKVRQARVMSIELIVWRTGMGYTPQQAATKLGIAVALYNAWESGQPVPFPHMVEGAIGVPTGPVIRQ